MNAWNIKGRVSCAVQHHRATSVTGDDIWMASAWYAALHQLGTLVVWDDSWLKWAQCAALHQVHTLVVWDEHSVQPCISGILWRYEMIVDWDEHSVLPCISCILWRFEVTTVCNYGISGTSWWCEMINEMSRVCSPGISAGTLKVWDDRWLRWAECAPLATVGYLGCVRW